MQGKPISSTGLLGSFDISCFFFLSSKSKTAFHCSHASGMKIDTPNRECCLVINSSCECLLHTRLQAEVKQWLYFMLERLSAYLWGIAAGFDSVMCVKRLNMHFNSASWVRPHQESFCLFMVLFFSFLNTEIYRIRPYIRVQRTLERVLQRIQNSFGDLWTIPRVK